MTNNGSFFSLSLSLRIHFAEIDLAPRNMTAAAVRSQQSAVSSSFDSLELRGRSVRFAERVEDHIVHAPGRKSKRLQEKE